MAKYTTQQIVAQFIKVHKDTYDYSQVNYIHSQTKVKIICKVHGIFEQLIGMHRQGQGCAKCIYDEKSSRRISSVTASVSQRLSRSSATTLVKAH